MSSRAMPPTHLFFVSTKSPEKLVPIKKTPDLQNYHLVEILETYRSRNLEPVLVGIKATLYMIKEGTKTKINSFKGKTMEEIKEKIKGELENKG